MNQAALDYVASFSHPKVKDAGLAVFNAIAQLVPEGQTTTPLIKMGDIAAVAQVNRRTVWTWLKVLVEIGEVRVVDGMQGRRARYTLAHLVGANPIEEAPLPLVGATPRRSRPRRTTVDATPDLFESLKSEEPAINDRSQGSQGSQVHPITRITWITWITWITSYVAATITWITRITCWRPQITIFETCDPCDPCDPALPLAVDDARAGAIRKSKYVVEKYEVVGGARAREVEEFLDWFAAEYAALHRGARCTIDRAADGERVNELLHEGRTLERLKAMTLRLWQVTTDRVVDSNRWYIAERAPVRNIWLLHRKADFLDIEVTLTHAPDMGESGVWPAVLKRLEAQVSRDTFHAWLRPLVVVDAGDVIQVGGQEAHVSWVQRNHAELVRQAVEDERPGARVEFVIDAAQQYG